MAVGTSFEVIGIDFIKTGKGQTQLLGRLTSGELLAAEAGQEMTDDRSGKTFDQLSFFMGARMTKEGGFFALKLAPAGACRAA